MALQVKFPFGTSVDVFVTHVDPSSGNIFVQINNEEAGKLDELMAEIEEFIARDRSREPSESEIFGGSIFLARYSVDGRWYRARVLAVKPAQCEVFFIDYGNTDLVPLSSLSKPPDKFLNLPPQAHECEIDGFSKLKTSNFQALVDFLAEQVLEQELVCRAISMKTSMVLVIQLFTDSSCSVQVLDAVRSSELVEEQGTAPTAKISTNRAAVAPKDKKFKLLNLTPGYYDVYITAVNSPYDFSCQLLSSSDSLELLMEQLAVHYTDLGPQDLPLQSCTPGYPCCAKFADDCCWYRALITKVGSVASGFIEVKFVDYGNSQQTPLTDVHELEDQFMSLPSQVIECLHHGIKQIEGYDDWPVESQVLFKKLTEDKHLVANVHELTSEGKYTVDLFDTTGDMDMQVSQILIAAGYAVKTSEFDPNPVRIPANSQPNAIPPVQPPVQEQAPPKPQSYQYKKESLTPGKEEKVLVTATVSPSKFYCQLFRMASKLEKLMLDIGNYYDRLSADEEWLSSPSVGDVCCARFSEDECWYRALVTEVLPSSQVRVQFIDYGNSETLPPKRVKKLVPRFSDLQSQGIECSLNRIKPLGKDWRSADIKKFNDIALEKEGKLTVVAKLDDGSHRVNLVLGGKKEVDVSEQMLLANCATLITGAVSQSENLHSIVAKEYTVTTVSVGDYEDVVVSYADSPATFWCQLVKYKAELDAVMNSLDEYCTSSGSKDGINSPRIGMPCCAMFSVDEGWYRGRVTGVKRNRDVEVQFVDYGNSEMMPASRLRAMKPEFMNLPAQAVKCELEHLGFDKKHHFSEELIEKFDQVTAEKELVAMIASYDKNNDQYVVVLHDATDGKNENILDLLTPLLPKQAGTIGVAIPKLKLQAGTKETVCVTSVTGISKFYCQKMSSSVQLDEMMLALEDHYAALTGDQEALADVSAGVYCAAKYTEDDAWYRAKVISTSSGSAEVHYIDYGNSETVPIARLKKLTSKFAELPQQIITSCLTGDRSGLSNTQFSDLVFDKTFDMHVIAVESDGVTEVDLVTKDTKKSIREHLTRTAVQTVEVPKMTLPAGSKEAGLVTSVTNTSKFYFQPNKSGGDLDEVMSNMESYYSGLSELQDALENPEVGLYCVSRFTEDDGWYRAKVSKAHANSVEVFYIDYGNSETLPLSRVKIIKPEFATLPAQVLECSLYNVSGPSDGPTETKFQTFVLEKELTAHVKAVGSSGAAQVELIDESGVSVAQSLGTGKEEEAVESVDTGFKPFKVTFSEGDFIDVEPLVCHSPHQFYCQVLTAERIAAFGKLTDSMTSYYSTLPPGQDQIGQPDIGMACCALYEVDNTWNRSTLVNVLGSDMVEVCFVDFGNVELTPISNIKALKPEFLALEEQAVLCRMSSIKPASGAQWSGGATQKFSTQVNQKQLVAKVLKIGKQGTDTCIEVNMFDTHDDARDDDIGELLVAAGLAIQSTPSAATSKGPSAKSLQKLKPSTSQDLYVTAADSPDKFYCQLAGTEDRLAALMENLGVFYEALQPDELVLTPLNPGSICCALYSEDGGWYRAVIQENHHDSATVRFIDYGNVEKVPHTSVKELTEEFMAEPVLAIECKLSGVCPTGNASSWSKESTDAFLGIAATDKVLTAQVKTQSEPYEVVLRDSSSDVSEALVTGKFAISSKNNKAAPVSKAVGVVAQDYKKPVVNIGAEIEALVTDMQSPGQFHCQLAATGDELDAMMNSMNEYYISLGSAVRSVTSPQVGQPCVAVYEEDESWYRARIQSISGNSANVIFTDYGNTQNVQLSDIKQIEPQFLELPLQAIECSLDCEKQAWSNQEIEMFLEITAEEKVTVKIVGTRGSRYLVKLFGKENLPISDTFLAKITITAPQIKPTDLSIANMPVNPGQTAITYTTNVREDGYFHVQLSESEAPLDQVMAQIAEIYPNLGPSEEQLTFPAVGAFCCALFTEDNTWYRAVITKMVSSSEAEVEFIDYGNSDLVPVISLKSLRPDICTSPRLSILCKLADTKASWSPDDAQLLESHTLEKALETTFVGQQGEAWLVRVKVVEGTNLNTLPEFGQQHGAPKALAYSKAMLRGKESAYFLSAEAIDRVWVQPCKTERELATLMNTIATNTSQPLTTVAVVPGQACLSQFTEDDGWYRAEVITVNNSSVHVMYVDYGNSEWLPAGRLREISDSLMGLPAQAVRCSLHGVSSNQAEAVVARLNEECAEKVVEVETLQAPSDGVHTVRFYDAETKKPLTGDSGAPAQEIQTKGSFTKSTFSVNNKEQAYFLSADGVDAVWLQPLKTEGELGEVMDAIAAGVTGQALLSTALQTGQPCLCQFTEDDVWYRAEIIEVQNLSAHVRYVDYGNSEWVPVDRLRNISDTLLKLPAQAVRCNLHGVSPSLAGIAVTKLNETCSEKCVEVEAVLLSGESPCVNLYDPETKKPILDNLSAPQVKEERSFTRASISNREQAYFLSADSIQEVWVQPCKTEGELAALMGVIAETDTNEKLSLSSLVTGTPCLGQFTGDDTWYRAEITDVKGSSVHVRYIDYGNAEWIAAEKLSPITESLLQLPTQAVMCSLYGIPESDRDQVVEKLNVGCEEQIVEVEVVERLPSGVPVVRLYSSETKELVIPQAVEPPPKAQESDAKLLFSKASFTTNAREQAYYLVADSATAVWLQPVNTENELTTLMDTIAASDKSQTLSLSLLVAGQACLSQFTEDDVWYRAEILEIKESMIHVRYVDYGNAEWIQVSRLRAISRPLLELPSQAVRCCLHEPSSASVEQLNEVFAEKTVEVEVVELSAEGLPIVNIYDLETKEQVTLQEATPVQEQEVCLKTLSFIKATFSSSEREQAHFLSADAADAVWMQPVKTEGALAALMETLATTKLDGPLTEASAAAGQPCLSQFTEDDAWYRAEIITADSGSVHVRYVDYGNSEWLPVTRLRPISESLLQLPAQAVRCVLDGAPDQQSVSKLNEICAEKSVEVQVVRQDPDGLGTVRLYDWDTKEPVLPIEIPEQLQESNQESLFYLKASFSSHEKEQAYFLSTDSADCVWLQPVKTETELTTLMETIALSPKNPLAGDTVAIGSACLSQFTEDDTWYRAEILGVLDGKAHVRYIDYGNSEWLPLERLSSVSKNLLVLPTQAVQCSLHGLTPSDDAVQIQKINELCAEKTLEVEVVEHTSDGLPSVRICDAETKEPVIFQTEPAAGEASPIQETLSYSKTTFSGTEKEHAYFLSAVSVDSVWLQPVKTETELATLMETIALSPKSALAANAVVPGAACLSQFTEDDTWYRAQVLEAKDGSIHVRYVDYGNSEWLPVERLGSVSKDLLHLPIQAVRCSLHGTAPSNEVIEKLNELCAEQTVEVEVVEQTSDGLPSVKLYDADTKELIDLLSTPDTEDVNAETNELIDLLSTPVTEDVKPTLEVLSYTKATFSTTEKEQAYFLSANAVDSLWLQPVKMESELGTLMETIVLGPKSALAAIAVVPGAACLSQFTEDDTWYRAQVLEAKDGSIHVRYVDYGNSEWLPVERLSSVSKDLLYLPTQAVQCSLHGIASSNEVIEKLIELCAEKTVEVEVVEQTSDGLPSVKLYDTETKEVIDLRSTPDTEDVKPTPEVLSYTKATFSTTEKEQAYFLSANAVDSLWLQPVKTESELRTLMETIALSPKSALAATAVVPGAACLSQFTEDDTWYRAQVLEAKDGSAHVRYIDYGNSEWLPFERLSSMTDSYLSLPIQAIRCTLFGISTSESNKAVEVLTELCSEKTVEVDVVGETEEGNYIVKLKDPSTQECINDKLIPVPDKAPIAPDVCSVSSHTVSKEGYDGPAFSRPQLKEGSDIVAFYVGGSSPDCIHLQIGEQHEKLLALMEQIGSSYSELDDEYNISEPKVKQLCCALYSEDEQWYRAEIQDTSNDVVVVKFVDYGNVESVPLGKVKQLKSEFLELPAQAFECQLARVIPSTADAEWPDKCMSWMEEILTMELRVEVLAVKDHGIYANLYFKTEEGENSVAQSLVDLGYGMFCETIVEKAVQESIESEVGDVALAPASEGVTADEEDEDEEFVEANEELPGEQKQEENKDTESALADSVSRVSSGTDAPLVTSDEIPVEQKSEEIVETESTAKESKEVSLTQLQSKVMNDATDDVEEIKEAITEEELMPEPKPEEKEESAPVADASEEDVYQEAPVEASTCNDETPEKSTFEEETSVKAPDDQPSDTDEPRDVPVKQTVGVLPGEEEAADEEFMDADSTQRTPTEDPATPSSSQESSEIHEVNGDEEGMVTSFTREDPDSIECQKMAGNFLEEIIAEVINKMELLANERPKPYATGVASTQSQIFEPKMLYEESRDMTNTDNVSSRTETCDEITTQPSDPTSSAGIEVDAASSEENSKECESGLKSGDLDSVDVKGIASNVSDGDSRNLQEEAHLASECWKQDTDKKATDREEKHLETAPLPVTRGGLADEIQRKEVAEDILSEVLKQVCDVTITADVRHPTKENVEDSSPALKENPDVMNYKEETAMEENETKLEQQEITQEQEVALMEQEQSPREETTLVKSDPLLEPEGSPLQHGEQLLENIEPPQTQEEAPMEHEQATVVSEETALVKRDTPLEPLGPPLEHGEDLVENEEPPQNQEGALVEHEQEPVPCMETTLTQSDTSVEPERSALEYGQHLLENEEPPQNQEKAPIEHEQEPLECKETTLAQSDTSMEPERSPLEHEEHLQHDAREEEPSQEHPGRALGQEEKEFEYDESPVEHAEPPLEPREAPEHEEPPLKPREALEHEEPPLEPREALEHEEPPLEPREALEHAEPPLEPREALEHEEPPLEPREALEHEEPPLEPREALEHAEPPLEPREALEHEEPPLEPREALEHEEPPLEPREALEHAEPPLEPREAPEHEEPQRGHTQPSLPRDESPLECEGTTLELPLEHEEPSPEDISLEQETFQAELETLEHGKQNTETNLNSCFRENHINDDDQEQGDQLTGEEVINEEPTTTDSKSDVDIETVQGAANGLENAKPTEQPMVGEEIDPVLQDDASFHVYSTVPGAELIPKGDMKEDISDSEGDIPNGVPSNDSTLNDLDVTPNAVCEDSVGEHPGDSEVTSTDSTSEQQQDAMPRSSGTQQPDTRQETLIDNGESKTDVTSVLPVVNDKKEEATLLEYGAGHPQQESSAEQALLDSNGRVSNGVEQQLNGSNEGKCAERLSEGAIQSSDVKGEDVMSDDGLEMLNEALEDSQVTEKEEMDVGGRSRRKIHNKSCISH